MHWYIAITVFTRKTCLCVWKYIVIVLEIISSGGLYGKLTIDSLGKVRPDTRNSALANILELMQVTENRYSGIPTIYHELQKAQLPPPAFCIRHGEFVVTFKSKISQVYDAPYATVSSVQEEQEQYNGQRAYSIEERLIEFAQCRAPDRRLLNSWLFALLFHVKNCAAVD